MKKLTVMLGSPREESISSTAAEYFIKGAQEAGYEIVEYNINQMAIGGCLGCGECRKQDTDCIVADDFEEYLKDLKESDALLITSPNYYGHIAGPMVTFMNRHYCLFDKNRNARLSKNRKVFGIFSQGAPAPTESYEKEYAWYIGIFEKLGMENIGHMTIGGGTDQEAAFHKLMEIGLAL